MMKTFGLAIAALGFTAGCAHETTPPPTMPTAEYRIGKEDVVAVEVWKDPTLSAKEPVRPDGKISLPMIGDITAEGRTAKDLQKEITAKLRADGERAGRLGAGLRDQRGASSSSSVKWPTPAPIRCAARINVLQALALAGGPTEYANRGGIVVIRHGDDGKEARYNVNYREIVSGKAQAIQLVPGDTVFVP